MPSASATAADAPCPMRRPELRRVALALLAALAVSGCASAPPAESCYSKDQVYENVGRVAEGGRIEPVTKEGRTLGWKLVGVSRDAPIRNTRFNDRDVVLHVCGISVEQFVDSQGPVCCSATKANGVRLKLRRPDDSTYEFFAPDAAAR